MSENNNKITQSITEKKKYKDTLYVPEYEAYWNHIPSINLPNTPWKLMGYSVSGFNTSFCIPELGLFLDAGVPHRWNILYQFITHGHADHYKCLRDGLFNINPKIKPTIVVPIVIKDKIKEDIYSGFALSKNNSNTNINNKYTMIGVKPNESIIMQIKNMKWKVEIFKCNHTVPTVGFGFIELRHKLKEEYKNLSQDELNSLRNTKIKLTEEKEYPLFCFLGDTDHKVFYDQRLEKYTTIIVECTFFEKDEDRVLKKKNNTQSEMEFDANKKKHMYWNNLKPIIQSRNTTLFILTHFSARYTQKQIHDFFNSQNLSNIHIWA